MAKSGGLFEEMSDGQSSSNGFAIAVSLECFLSLESVPLSPWPSLLSNALGPDDDESVRPLSLSCGLGVHPCGTLPSMSLTLA